MSMIMRHPKWTESGCLRLNLGEVVYWVYFVGLRKNDLKSSLRATEQQTQTYIFTLYKITNQNGPTLPFPGCIFYIPPLNSIVNFWAELLCGVENVCSTGKAWKVDCSTSTPSILLQFNFQAYTSPVAPVSSIPLVTAPIQFSPSTLILGYLKYDDWRW